LAKHDHNRETSDLEQATARLAEILAPIAAEYERAAYAAVAEDMERQAREAGLDDATIAKVRLHSHAREQWRWN
jgi:hypothetical protein